MRRFNNFRGRSQSGWEFRALGWLPWELSGLAAPTRPDVLTAFGRIFAEEIARATKRLADVEGAETGAVGLCALR